MARRALEGGRVALEIGVGQAQLDQIDAARERRGWSRAEWFRRASAALLRADGHTLPVSTTTTEEADVDPDDAIDALEEPHTGAIIPRGASRMGRGRWAGWYPQDLTDAEVVADLRQHVPGGVVHLRRPVSPDALVHAYVDTVEEAARLEAFGPVRFFRRVGTDDLL